MHMKTLLFSKQSIHIGCIALILGMLMACHSKQSQQYASWQVYGGNKENNHYSSLTQIDTNNVALLKSVWEYHCGDAGESTQIQVNPIIVDGILYGVSPQLKLFALDAANGQHQWSFNPLSDTAGNDKTSGYFMMNVCRGVTYYANGANDRRIFYAAGAKLYCINASNGKPILSFGNGGSIDLHQNLGTRAQQLYVASTTPGIIYKDMIIIGTRVAEEMPAAPGDVRAYDVHNGKLRWIFHTIPQPGEPGFHSWDDTSAYRQVGGANAWAGFSMDENKGIVYVPTGSAVYDFYGGLRLGNNLFANTLIALNANNGKEIWHYQTVHHDLWDRDLPTAPALLTLTINGKKIETVAQPTKTGFIFLFNRINGKPVFPIVERPVPTFSELTGEQPAPTQPYPVLPAPFARQSLTEKDLNHLVPDSSFHELQQRLSSYKTGRLFIPPSKEGTIIFPGFDGGAEWGGPAADPTTGILYVNASEMPWVLTMVDAKNKVPPAGETNLQAGIRLYRTHCMACHGTLMQGSGNYPWLFQINKKYNKNQFEALLTSGRRMMPSFQQLTPEEKNALATYVLAISSQQHQKFIAPAKTTTKWDNMPYTSTGYNKFLSREGYPAVAPPWGTLTAINLNTGQLVWKDTIGDYPEWKAKGIHTGTENYGGPVVTAGGLLFIAATSDAKIRAFNKTNGKLLWEADLPACGFATPAVYAVNGKQYVVIACGGGKLKKPSGDSYVAFALPDAQK